MSDAKEIYRQIMRIESQFARYRRAIEATEGKSADEMPLEWAEVMDAIKEMQEPL